MEIFIRSLLFALVVLIYPHFINSIQIAHLFCLNFSIKKTHELFG
uniref:Uncharacterized protein n=1 Tax=Lepeophtheirus salmonis TaxID=72036 RepID=A0A0K2TUN8_LEPSM